MEEKMINVFLESFAGKEDAPSEDDVIHDLIEIYISDRMLVEKWEESGLEEEWFESWIKMYLAPFEDITYDRILFILNLLNDTRIFDEYMLYFNDIDELNKETNEAMLEIRYQMLRRTCNSNSHFQKKYVKTLLEQVSENIKKVTNGSSCNEK